MASTSPLLPLRSRRAHHSCPSHALTRHAYSDCDPSNYQKVHAKKRCPVPGCREKLTAVSSFTCKDCATVVCLKHRLGSDHACSAQRQQRADSAGAAEGRLRAIRSFFSSRAGGGGQAPSGGAAGSGRAGAAAPQSGKQRLAAAASRVGGSLATQLSEYRARLAAHRAAESGRPAPAAAPPEVIDLSGSSSSPSPQPPVRRGAGRAATQAGARAAGSSGGAEEEVCPVCGAAFASVEALIDHAVDAHTGGWASGPVGMQQQHQQQQALERCPHCGQGMGDEAALVAHVERCASAPRAAAVSGTERCSLS